MKLGVIESGSLTGKKIILEPRRDLKDNEWLVEEGKFLNDSLQFHRYCLVCEQPIPANGCSNCN